jgi:hypothetical protein
MQVMRQRALSVTKGKGWYGLCPVVPAVVRCSVLYFPSLGMLISPDLRRLFSMLTKNLWRKFPGRPGNKSHETSSQWPRDSVSSSNLTRGSSTATPRVDSLFLTPESPPSLPLFLLDLHVRCLIISANAS